MKYLRRIVDDIIEEKLQTTGAVVIRGPKWCGKTTSAKNHAKSFIELQSDIATESYKMLASMDMNLLLSGENPRLIDEWQEVPKVWNAIKADIDKRNTTGLYILTGSSTPKDNELQKQHSGAGRFSFVNMKPMALFESGESTGVISLRDILNNKREISGLTSNIDYRELAMLTCRGGWPSSIGKNEKISLDIVKEYINVICEFDVIRVDGIRRNPILARDILRAYARKISTVGPNTAIYEDINFGHSSASRQTILEYINAFKRLYIIDEVEAWNPNLRSQTAIRTSAKKGFTDPSIAAAVLECSPEELLNDPNTFGLLFENLVSRDLSIYVEKVGGYLRHYRDRHGLECDQVIHFNNGKYGLVQTKLSLYGVEQGIEKLRKLRDLIRAKSGNIGNKNDPEFLMVITGSDKAFVTLDGILVVPIGCLKD